MTVKALDRRPEGRQPERQPREVNPEAGARYHVVGVNRRPRWPVKGEPHAALVRDRFLHAMTC
jgi:hypothetical protein